MIPAWVVAIYALASIIGILSIRPMPLLIRLALVAPRVVLASIFLFYQYSIVQDDLAGLALVVLFGVELLTATAVRWQWRKGRSK